MRTVIRYVLITSSWSRGGERGEREKERGRERALTRRSIHNIACLPSVSIPELGGVTSLIVSRFSSQRIMTEHRVVPASGTRIDSAASDDRSPLFANDGV